MENPSWYDRHSSLVWGLIYVSMFVAFELIMTATAGPQVWTWQALLLVNGPLGLVLIWVYMGWLGRRAESRTKIR